MTQSGTNLYDELQCRGMVSEATEGLKERFATEHVTAYIGFDPTASSLHVGSLLTVMGLARLQRFGHAANAVVGGGNGNDCHSRGKVVERVLLSPEQIEADGGRNPGQLTRFPRLDAPVNAARIVNNADW